MIIVVGGTKGGTGKTTTSTNIAAVLAHSGHPVMLVDADPQLNARNWVDRRNTMNPDLAKIEGVKAGSADDLHNVLKKLHAIHHNIVVDVGGFDSREFRSASLVANIVLLPVQASQFDLESLPVLSGIIKDTKLYNPALRVLGMISKAHTNRSVSESEIAETREIFGAYDFLTPLNTVIYDRKIYKEVVRDGRGVIEAKDDRAADEYSKLISEVFSHVQ